MADRQIPDINDLKSKYPSNSYKSRQEQVDIPSTQDPDKKEVCQVVKKVRVRKQSTLKKLGKSIFADSFESAKEHVYEDIVVPSLKALIFDTVTDIFDTILFGDSDSRPRGSSRLASRTRREGRISYSDYYDNRASKKYRSSKREDTSYEPDDIILDTRSEARDVLDELDHIIRRYGQASVADFYDIVGVTGTWTDNQYGWTSLRDASIKPIRDGYMILLPRTTLLDD